MNTIKTVFNNRVNINILFIPLFFVLLVFSSSANKLNAQNTIQMIEVTNSLLVATLNGTPLPSGDVTNVSPDVWVVDTPFTFVLPNGPETVGWIEPETPNPPFNFNVLAFGGNFLIDNPIINQNQILVQSDLSAGGFNVLVPDGVATPTFTTTGEVLVQFIDKAAKVEAPEPATMAILSSTLIAAMFRNYRSRKTES